jgi:hypothetical protein
MDGHSQCTAWFPEGSPEAILAMEELVKRQTLFYSVSWEYWDEADEDESAKS